MQCNTRTYLQVINAVYRNHEQYAVHAIKHDFGSAIPQDMCVSNTVHRSTTLTCYQMVYWEITVMESSIDPIHYFNLTLMRCR